MDTQNPLDNSEINGNSLSPAESESDRYIGETEKNLVSADIAGRNWLVRLWLRIAGN